MSPHDQDHEEVLLGVLCGDLAENGARARGVLQSCDECRARLEDLRTLSDLLEEAGRAQRATLQSLDPSRSAPGSDRIAPFVRARVAEIAAARPGRAPAAAGTAPDPWGRPRPIPLGQQPPRRRAVLKITAAAASVIATGWIARLFIPRADVQRQETTLGSGSIRGLSPGGQVGGFAAFEWDFPLPPGGWYKIRVWGSGSEEWEDPLLESPRLFEPRWTPTPDRARELPQRIHWRVDAFDATGGVAARGRSEAWRSPR